MFKRDISSTLLLEDWRNGHVTVVFCRCRKETSKKETSKKKKINKKTAPKQKHAAVVKIA